ncbi:MAG: helix-turn-helix transcriptional regulator [Planctomycetota bacterium]|nr:helix-turn-helix transcriptional regulator [Planctomycetota bacterium]
MLIDQFRKRVLKEIAERGETLKQFATRGLRMPTKRLRGMLGRKNLRLGRCDEVALVLGLATAQLLTDDLVIESGELPPATEVVQAAIDAALQREDLTGAMVAEALGITRQALSKDLVRGNPSLSRLEQIAGIFEMEPWRLCVPPDVEIIGGKDDK